VFGIAIAVSNSSSEKAAGVKKLDYHEKVAKISGKSIVKGVGLC